MPTYEYECKSCGYNFEVFQSMSEEPLKICAKCGKEVRRLILGGAGVIFKGSGFYVTDKGKGKSAAAPSAAAAPAAAKTDNKSATAKNAPPAAVPANPKPTNGDAA
jgi:putative FmdB family regulatory protein